MSKIVHEKNFKEGVFRVYNDEPEFCVHHQYQIHSNIILNYDRERYEPTTDADGIIANPKTLTQFPLGVKTADCLPILLIGHKIALIHAGWKGLATGILDNTLLKDEYFHTAYIGPSIQKYEVQEDFKNNFPANPHFFSEDSKLYFNLQAEAQSQCEKNFPGVKVYNSKICTLNNTDYNSFRRNKTEKRNWNIFILNK